MRRAFKFMPELTCETDPHQYPGKFQCRIPEFYVDRNYRIRQCSLVS